ncbi:MAG: DNA-binding protein [Negativicutes bacterium]|nr:DNA-binding protein [Negativicutes bacterium]
MPEDVGFEQRMRLVRLYDIYGGLLTDRQQKCMEMHFYNDLSLSEIADEYSVSRQAIYDLLRRAEQLLEKYESRLKLFARNQENNELILHAEELLSDYINDKSNDANLELVQTILRELSDKGRA